MKKLYKDILLGLFTSIIIVGIIYGSNVYFSLQESKQRKERHKQEEERREKIKKYREILEKQRDSIRVSGKLQHPHSIEEYDLNDDQDLYDNPDFDDLIPGEEYDEEFVDRTTGDPELYD